MANRGKSEPGHLTKPRGRRPPASAEADFDEITYVPADGDPVCTTWAGIKFTANAPVKVPKSKTIEQLWPIKSTMRDGTVQTRHVEKAIPMVEVAKGNVRFLVNGAAPAQEKRRAICQPLRRSSEHDGPDASITAGDGELDSPVTTDFADLIAGSLVVVTKGNDAEKAAPVGGTAPETAATEKPDVTGDGALGRTMLDAAKRHHQRAVSIVRNEKERLHKELPNDAVTEDEVNALLGQLLRQSYQSLRDIVRLPNSVVLDPPDPIKELRCRQIHALIHLAKFLRQTKAGDDVAALREFSSRP